MTAPAAEAVERLRTLLLANHDGEAVGVPSVCSAEPAVLAAALQQAHALGGLALIESTCNQVNQEGGYTGLTPAAFRDHVHELAADAGLPAGALVLGGDHLGPYPWRAQPAAEAMAKARSLVHACVGAGYAKIHLDPSMPLGDDGGSVDEALVLARTVDLCACAEEARRDLPPDAPAPLYVIGTEVPAPGGEREDGRAPQAGPRAPAGDSDQEARGRGPRPTRAGDVRRFLAQAERAFTAAGLEDAWRRVVAVVVQPGVEFDDAHVYGYEPRAARELPVLLDEVPSLVYEAHSTDYQTEAALAALVRDHFGILKVGPALTFALREALFALEGIERELLAGGAHGGAQPSHLRETLDAAMRAAPGHWLAYYPGDEAAQALARAFSYSDRSRYYWPAPEVQGALDRLLRNLAPRPIPPTLLSQYLPEQYAAVRSGALAPSPPALVTHKVRQVLLAYWRACGVATSP